MSNKISRRAFLKCAGVSAAAVGSASLLSGCKTNGSNTTVNDVKVGDTVKNWNGLGVQLSSVFHLTQDPAQPGYEYLGVRVTVLNRSKTETYTIGAQGGCHQRRLPCAPLFQQRDANFQAMAAATTGLCCHLRRSGAAISATVSLAQLQLPELFRHEPAPPAHRAAMLMVPEVERELQVTYMPTLPRTKATSLPLYHEGRRRDPRLRERFSGQFRRNVRCSNFHTLFCQKH